MSKAAGPESIPSRVLRTQANLLVESTYYVTGMFYYTTIPFYVKRLHCLNHYFLCGIQPHSDEVL